MTESEQNLLELLAHKLFDAQTTATVTVETITETFHSAQREGTEQSVSEVSAIRDLK